eukprot:1157373-Pelagomonas_calceolata.AAC.1
MPLSDHLGRIHGATQRLSVCPKGRLIQHLMRQGDHLGRIHGATQRLSGCPKGRLIQHMMRQGGKLCIQTWQTVLSCLRKKQGSSRCMREAHCAHPEA